MKKLLYLIPIIVVVQVCAGHAFSTNECDLEAAKRKTDQAILVGDNADELARLAREAISLCYEYAPAHNALGTALEMVGEYDDAVNEYKIAAELSPEWYLPYLGLGDVEQSRGNIDRAVEYYKKSLDLAGTGEERSEVEKTLSKLISEGEEGYSFKTADNIKKHLRIGEKSVLPKSPGEWVPDEDYGIDETGYLVNLTVLFKFDSAEIQSVAGMQLDQLAEALIQSGPEERFTIEGHASTEGDSDYNMQLSLRRAESVVSYLAENHGIPSLKLEAVGKGISFPVIEDGKENKIKSRRVRVIRQWD